MPKRKTASDDETKTKSKRAKTDTKEFIELKNSFEKIIVRIYDQSKPSLIFNVKDSTEDKTRNYRLDKLPETISILDEKKNLIYLPTADYTLWKHNTTKQNYTVDEILQDILYSDLRFTIVALYDLPLDTFFNDSEKLYFQENFVKRKDPDFDDPNNYFTFEGKHDLAKDFYILRLDPGKRTERIGIGMFYDLK